MPAKSVLAGRFQGVLRIPLELVQKLPLKARLDALRLTKESVVAMIEHTLLKPTATEREVERLCAEARHHGFQQVGVSQAYVPLARSFLMGSNVRIGTVVGFPHGSSSPEAKAFAARTAVHQGATEIDMVLNVGALKSKDYELVKKDIRSVVKAVQRRGLPQR